MFLTGDSQPLFGGCSSSVHFVTYMVLAGIVVAGSIIYTVYQLFFHPLSQYPGPILARLTQWYDVYHAYTGDKHILFHELHQKYGPVVRYSPNALSINDPEALKAIYSHGANVQKSVFYKCFRAAPTAISTLLATEKHHHARKRRVMGQAFSDQAVRGFEQYVVGHVQDLVDRIGSTPSPSSDTEKSSWTAPLDMSKWCGYLSFDVMSELTFGKSFGTLGDRPENRKGIFLLGRAARRNYVVAAMPALISTGAEKILPILRGLFVDRGKYLAFGKQKVMERTQESKAAGNPAMESGRRDIFSFLLTAKDPETGQGFPMNELWMEGNTLIVAGSDTTSTTLSACIHYLLHNPHVLKRLENEVRSTFKHAADIRMGTQLQSCSYLRACIDETMRMTPAVGGNLPREVLKGGLSIPSLGMDLPAGIDVGVPIYAIHHHSEYVVEPFRFDPDRWLPAQEGAAPHPQSRAALSAVYNPFSIGHRACLGKPLVYMQLSIALATLVWEFDLRLAEEQHTSTHILRDLRAGRRQAGEYQLLDWFMSQNEGPFVECRRRELILA